MLGFSGFQVFYSLGVVDRVFSIGYLIIVQYRRYRFFYVGGVGFFQIRMFQARLVGDICGIQVDRDQWEKFCQFIFVEFYWLEFYWDGRLFYQEFFVLLGTCYFGFLGEGVLVCYMFFGLFVWLLGEVIGQGQFWLLMFIGQMQSFFNLVVGFYRFSLFGRVVDQFFKRR